MTEINYINLIRYSKKNDPTFVGSFATDAINKS